MNWVDTHVWYGVSMYQGAQGESGDFFAVSALKAVKALSQGFAPFVNTCNEMSKHLFIKIDCYNFVLFVPMYRGS